MTTPTNGTPSPLTRDQVLSLGRAWADFQHALWAVARRQQAVFTLGLLVRTLSERLADTLSLDHLGRDLAEQDAARLAEAEDGDAEDEELADE